MSKTTDENILYKSSLKYNNTTKLQLDKYVCDTMESHPLNLAHQQHRRAEAHLLNNRYDEAMQCHHNAAELLLDAMKSTTSSVALESISLQHSYHLKQKDLIKSKKEQYTRVKKTMENMKNLGKEPNLYLQVNDGSKLQVAIYKNMNESESLLHLLAQNKEQEAKNDIVTRDVADGKKTEKSQQTVVEELQILSQNLHSLIDQLVLQVEVLKDENMTLKERVNYFEKERLRYLNIPSQELVQENKVPGMLFVSEDTSELSQTDRFPESSKMFNVPADRVPVQPNFDLSAFKNN